MGTRLPESSQICLSQSHLKERVSLLRDLNGDLLDLMESLDRVQVAGLRKCNSSETETRSRQLVENSNVVQYASQTLYEALANFWSCSTHTTHSASICLDQNVATAGTCDPAVSQRVKFDLALDCMPKLSHSRDAPIWLAIETGFESSRGRRPECQSSARSTNWITDAVHVPKRRASNSSIDVSHRQSNEDHGRKKDKISISAQPRESGDTKKNEMMASEIPPNPENVTLPDLCSRRDLCLFLEGLHQCSQNSKALGCVGVLDPEGAFRHLVYHGTFSIAAAESISLHKFISDLPNDKQIPGLSSLERVRLALSLSIAVLQFNSSAWLPETWRSSNIHFYGWKRIHASGQGLGMPFLNIGSKLKESKSDFGNDDEIMIPNDRPPSPIRNEVLFGLGVILLELGFELPIEILHRKNELESGQKHQYSDYMTAVRLKRSVEKPLGGRFGRLTRKCLDCDFGTGEHGLRSPALKEAFHKDVIMELESLEKLSIKLDLY